MDISTRQNAPKLGESSTSMQSEDGTYQLLRAVCRSGPDQTPDRIAQLAAEVGDWEELLVVAREHRIVPMVFGRLDKIADTLPPRIYKSLRSDFEGNAVESILNATELVDLLGAFAHDSIPALPFKGVVLAASVYGDLTTRPAGDIDLLIQYDDLLRATAILLGRGYSLMTPVQPDGWPLEPDYFEYHFERPSDGRIVELRWRLELTQPRFRRNLGMDWAWPSRRTTMLAGAEVPNMGPEITLLMLCMHGCKHAWSRAIWINDIARLMASPKGLDWDDSIREAKRSGLWRALALGVLLAHRVCAAEVPPAILRQFERDTAAYRLARHFEECLFNAPGSAPPGRIPYSVRLLDFQDRMRLIFSFQFLKPNERDIAGLALPRPLRLLYLLWRPLRILFDRSPRF